MQGARYEWACFQAQQAAEKAIISLLYAEGYRKILTHPVYELLLESRKRAECMPCLEREAKLLDNVYITSRYPNGLPGSMIPCIDQCLHSPGLILDAFRRCMQK